MLLEGKKALVTGGGRGIGRGIALGFAQQGCDVAVTARSGNEIEDTATMIREMGRNAAPLVCDVTDEEAVTAMVKAAHEELGGIDILVNNAGYADFRPFEELSYQDFHRTLEVNVLSVVACTHAVLPIMKAAGHGRIINIGSVAGLKPIPKQSAYVASKHALVGLSETLAMELLDYNIAVHCICPGGVDTQLAEEAMPERDKTHWMTPEDIAHAAIYLASLSPRATTDTMVVRRFASKPIGG